MPLARGHLRDRLVLTFAPLVKYIVYKKVREMPSRCEVEDFISCGLEALIQSIDRYDPEKGATLEQYAWTRIHGAVLDELRRQDWAPRSVRRWERDIEKAVEILRLKGAKGNAKRADRSTSEGLIAVVAEVGLRQDGDVERIVRIGRLRGARGGLRCGGFCAVRAAAGRRAPADHASSAEGRCRVSLHAWEHVLVDGYREGGAAVAEAFADHLGWDAGGERGGSVAVADVMEPDRRQAGAAGQPPEPVADDVRRQVRAEQQQPRHQRHLHAPDRPGRARQPIRTATATMPASA